MYLRELKVNGFKSFAEPTRLNFDPGVTAIVGPNGCGKSNIADAIRWVLGEQSAKALRGGKMQDVIFEGTDKRKPVQLCEVALIFTECETLLGDSYHEVEITRRVARDGQSDYFLNGKACRLKDIQRIFMDTGIGRSSYSIMAQGQIDQILSSNPVERRAIFEEAAGITKYKSQRREALNKLKLVEGNLARLTDVLDEVRRQINSLRRQASKALRYKRIRHRLEKLDLAFNGYQYRRLETVLSEMEGKISALEAGVAEETGQLERNEAAVEERKAERSRLNAKLQDVQQAVFDLRSRREQADNSARLAEARKEDYAARLEESRGEIARMEKDLEETNKEAEGSARSKEEQHDAVAGSDRIFREIEEEVQGCQSRLNQEEQQLASEKHNLLRAESDVTRLRSKRSELELNLKSDEVRAARFDEEIASLVEEEKDADANLSRLGTEIEKADGVHAEAQKGLEEARNHVVRSREAYRGKQAEIQEVDRALAQNNARLRLLQQLQEKLEGFSEGAKALLQGKLDHALPEGAEFYPVTRNIHVKAGYAKALETLLGSAIDSVAVADPDVAQTVVEVLDQQKLGKACLHFSLNGRGEGKGSTREFPAFLKPATDLFTADGENGTHPLHGLLARSYYADSAADFFDFWKNNEDFDFLHVVTGKGELIDRRGLVFGGFGKGKENSILQREAEIQELMADIAEEQKHHSRLKEEAEKLQEKLEEAEKGVESAHEAVREADGKRSSLRAERQSAERAREETVARRTRMEGERGKLQEQRASAQLEFDSLKNELTEAEGRFEKQKETIADCESRIQDTRKALEAQKEKLSEARFDLAQKRQRLEMLDRGLSEMETKTRELRQGIAHRKQEVERMGEQIGSLEDEHRTQQERSRELEVELVEAQEKVEAVRKEYAAVEEAISSSEKALHDKRAQLDKRRSELSHLQIKHAEQKSHREHLIEEVHREYEVALSDVDWKECLWRAEEEPAGPHPLDLDDDDSANGKRPKQNGEPRPPMTEEDRKAFDETDWDAIKKEIESARGRIHSMGPVNLVAIEEYVELKERHEFLSAQHTDLVQSRDELLQAIDDINHRSTTQFREIFEQIKKNFGYTFEKLFGGGKATLELFEADDPLEAGIDIIAQPPGTKLKGIVLLSGGQKTMTAVALLFAIYMVKPSPFCVLDELDAPLDEANIGRFTEMLKEFTRESQFLIITHNKRTISEAQAIFGVTMEEKGVSKVVSMRFNQHKQRAESHEGAAVPVGTM